MIYHYFDSKESLFQRVLEDAYVDIRTADKSWNSIISTPRMHWKSWCASPGNIISTIPNSLPMVNSENLHKARHLKKSKVVQDISRRLVTMVDTLLERGAKQGLFRDGIDPVQLNITIAAIGYYYFTNRFTGAIIYERDLMSREALDTRLQFNIDTIMRLVCK